MVDERNKLFVKTNELNVNAVNELTNRYRKFFFALRKLLTYIFAVNAVNKSNTLMNFINKRENHKLNWKLKNLKKERLLIGPVRYVNFINR